MSKSSKKKKQQKKKQTAKKNVKGILNETQAAASAAAVADVFTTGSSGTAAIEHEKKESEPNVKFEKKIRLEKKSHSYISALNGKYEKHLKKVKKPLKIILLILGGIVLLIVLFVAALFITFGRDLPDVTKLKDINFDETTHIYDRNGNELYGIFGSENREYVKLADIAPDVIHATISIEDKNFYHEFGFDPVGIIRAEFTNIQDNGITEGASTITQQLAKNVFLTPDRTYQRKIKEILLSMEIETYFSKNEILEMYFNKIAYGSNAFGIEAASKTFFGIPAKNLNLVQSSVLASLPKAPTYYSPYGENVKELMGYCSTDTANSITDGMTGMTQQSTQQSLSSPSTTQQQIVPAATTCTSPYDKNYVWGRKDYVLQRMVQDGYITQNQMLQAWQDGLHLKFIDPVHSIVDPHFVFYVKDYLIQKYGQDMVENGGLQVITTLDPTIQKAAEKAMADNTDLIHRFGADNAAMVAVDPKSGQIMAMVGSLNYWDQSIDGNVNVALNPRQPGSSFKPLVYAAAIQNAGIGTGTYLDDVKTIFNQHDTPSDYDGHFLGHITIRQAIGGSRNIPAIKAFYVAGGEDKVLDFVDKLGVTNLRQFRDAFNKDAAKRGWTFYFGWPMAIGSGEVRLLDLVNAYAVFADQGIYHQPNPILEVRDRNGVLLDSFDNGPDTGKQAIDPQIAYIITNILTDVSVRPPGSWRALLTVAGHTLAAKTGTSNKKVNNVDLPNNDMTIGYTPSLAAGFWVGNSNGKNLINNAYSLYTSDPMFHEFWTSILQGKPDEPFVKPPGVKQIGREFYPSWGGPKNFESMFKTAVDTQQVIPLPDFLSKTPADIKAYQNTLKQQSQQQTDKAPIIPE